MKLIAIDLDGTLLNHEKMIMKDNIEAIRHAQERGVEVIVATGRHYQDAKHMINRSGLDLPIIGSNGASIHDINGKCSQCIGIAPEDLALIYTDLSRLGISFVALGAKYVYTLNQSLDIMHDEVERFKTPAFEKDMYRIKKELRAMVESSDGLIYDDPLQLASADDVILNILAVSYDAQKRLGGMAHFGALNRFHVFSSYKNNFEMTHPDVSKGNSVKLYAAEKGIKPADICAIGDNYNDVSMIQMAGFGVAMGNAEDGVKSISDFVTLTNNEAGVAHAIRKIIFP